jgi:hypothetical protein
MIAMPESQQAKKTPSGMIIETRPLDAITPYEGNPRVISDTAIEKVATSLREYGWQQPIVVDPEGVIIAGHTRLAAARKLGLAEVPVVVATDLTSAQVRAYRLMDNRSHEDTGWDAIGLLDELDALAAEDVDLTLVGFDPGEVASLRGSKGSPLDPDAEWEGMPDFEQEQKTGAFRVTVHFATDADADRFFELLGKPRRSSMWWPEPDGHVGSSLGEAWVDEGLEAF